MAARKKWTRGGWRPGAGAKPIYRERVRITVDLEREELDGLNELARASGEPRGHFLRRTIRRLVAAAARRGG
jgi:hypothetical protein